MVFLVKLDEPLDDLIVTLPALPQRIKLITDLFPHPD